MVAAARKNDEFDQSDQLRQKRQLEILKQSTNNNLVDLPGGGQAVRSDGYTQNGYRSSGEIPSVANDINNRILRQNKQKEDSGDSENKEKKRKGTKNDVADDYLTEEELRQSKARAKKYERAKKAQKMMAPEKMDVFGNSIKVGTNRALQWAWYTLIPSWGISLLYIDLHVILSLVFGNHFFCKLGEEWIPPQAKKAAGKDIKKSSSKIRIVEIIVVIGLNILAFFFGISVLAFFYAVIQFMTMSTLEKAGAIWGIIKEGAFTSWEGIKALYNLFKDLS